MPKPPTIPTSSSRDDRSRAFQFRYQYGRTVATCSVDGSISGVARRQQRARARLAAIFKTQIRSSPAEAESAARGMSDGQRIGPTTYVGFPDVVARIACPAKSGHKEHTFYPRDITCVRPAASIGCRAFCHPHLRSSPPGTSPDNTCAASLKSVRCGISFNPSSLVGSRRSRARPALPALPEGSSLDQTMVRWCVLPMSGGGRLDQRPAPPHRFTVWPILRPDHSTDSRGNWNAQTNPADRQRYGSCCAS